MTRTRVLDRAYYDSLCWDEYYLDQWFQDNHKKLGFAKITNSIPIIGCADYIGVRDGVELVIELEGPLRHINAHQQWVLNKIDVIICFGGYSATANGKEVIRLVDHPEFLAEAVNHQVVYNLIKNREMALKRFAEDARTME